MQMPHTTDLLLPLARRRDHDDVAGGTPSGSNLFDGLAVVGPAASIRPIGASLHEVGVAVAFGLPTPARVLPRRGARSRRRRFALLQAGAGFIAATSVAAA